MALWTHHIHALRCTGAACRLAGQAGRPAQELEEALVLHPWLPCALLQLPAVSTLIVIDFPQRASKSLFVVVVPQDTKPLGVIELTNPLDSSGAKNREVVTCIVPKLNAPLSHAALQVRVVSEDDEPRRRFCFEIKGIKMGYTTSVCYIVL